MKANLRGHALGSFPLIWSIFFAIMPRLVATGAEDRVLGPGRPRRVLGPFRAAPRVRGHEAAERAAGLPANRLQRRSQRRTAASPLFMPSDKFPVAQWLGDKVPRDAASWL